MILVGVPHRYDLSDWSCVDCEVKTFNRKLEKPMKPYKHVTVVQVDLKRKFFTKRGLHKSSVGKEKVVLKVANIVITTVQK
jgi:hypothetical protein